MRKKRKEGGIRGCKLQKARHFYKKNNEEKSHKTCYIAYKEDENKM
jgi:hypothetical protein